MRILNQKFFKKKYISKSNTVNNMKLMILKIKSGEFAHVPPAHVQRVYTRCAWAEGTYAMFPDFCENLTIHVRDFLRIIDRTCWACVFFHQIPNLQACTDGRRE